MTTALTQNEVYTPAEAFAFHRGHEEATVERFANPVPVAKLVEGLTTPEEADAYRKGYETGVAKFNGTVYSTPIAD